MNGMREIAGALIGLALSGLLFILFGGLFDEHLSTDLERIGRLFIFVTVLLGIAVVVFAIAKIGDGL